MKPALLFYPHISSYPVLMLAGFVFGWMLARRRTSLYGIGRNHVDNIGLLLPLAGVFGARFFARLFYAKLPLLEALQAWKGDGLVFYGGFIFGIAAVLVYGAFRHLNLVRLCDCLAPSVALGLAFGRTGCFLGGCCWGDLCVDQSAVGKLEPSVVRQVRTVPALSGAGWRVALRFPAGSEPFKQHIKLGLLTSSSSSSLPTHPVQLYEAGLATLLAFWLHRRFRGNHEPGSGALALLAGYAVIRFFTEYLRADNRLYLADLTVSQVISIEILAFGLVVVLLRGAWSLKRRRLAAAGKVELTCEVAA